MARKDSITLAVDRLSTYDLLQLHEALQDSRSVAAETISETVLRVEKLTREALRTAFLKDARKPKRKPKNGSIPPQAVQLTPAQAGIVALPIAPLQPFMGSKGLSDQPD